MNDSLWQKIQNFDFDYPLSEYGFTTRLARENSWTLNFTKDAVLEYKKFMYLAATADAMVSPSEIVDVVWHQHLIFSQSYNEFCNLIGKRIEHVPSTHNREDYEKFAQAKERTKKLYVNEFGEQPEQYWNFSNIYAPLALEKAKYKIRTFVLLGILGVLLALAPFYFALRNIYQYLDNPLFVVWYIILSIAIFGYLEIQNRRRLEEYVKTANRNSFIFDLTALELVYLKTRRLHNVIHGYVSKMVQQDKLDIQSDYSFTRDLGYGITSPQKYVVFETIKNYNRLGYPELLGRLLEKSVFSNIGSSLNAFKKYFIKSKVFSRIFYFNFYVLATMLLLGLVRLITGLQRDKPVTIISVVLIVFLALIVFYLIRLTTLMTSVTIPKTYENEIVPNSTGRTEWEWSYFLNGSTVLTSSLIPVVLMMERNN